MILLRQREFSEISLEELEKIKEAEFKRGQRDARRKLEDMAKKKSEKAAKNRAKKELINEIYGLDKISDKISSIKEKAKNWVKNKENHPKIRKATYGTLAAATVIPAAVIGYKKIRRKKKEDDIRKKVSGNK